MLLGEEGNFPQMPRELGQQRDQTGLSKNSSFEFLNYLLNPIINHVSNTNMTHESWLILHFEKLVLSHQVY